MNNQILPPSVIRHSLFCALALTLAWLPDGTAGELRLPSVIGDHMVLQRETENPIWGWAEPGRKITVGFAGHTLHAKANAGGRWQVALPKLKASAEGREMSLRSDDGTTLAVRDVLVGEVWFFSGPSNIYWPVERCANAKQEIAAANYPAIRFFATPKKLADEPQDDCGGQWAPCSPETIGSASGVAYFFSRRLHRALDVPIGALQSFWGGTRVEGWTSAEAVAAEPSLAPVVDWWDQAIAGYDLEAERKNHRRAMEQWRREANAAQSRGAKAPPQPRMPVNPAKSFHRPGRLFNGMVAPLIPFGIRGAVTYQGLGNLYWAEYGETLMATMFRDWRKRWGRGDFPIGMIQPAPFPTDGWKKQLPEAYLLQREAQLQLLKTLPNMGLAPTLDIVNLRNVHFPQKQPVAKRMAQWALAEVYGRPVGYGGPVYRSMAVEGNAIRIHFENTRGGLKTSDGKAPTGFTIAGDDGKFVPADAVIDGDSVLVSSGEVPQPVAVQFAWSDTATSNLRDGDGLPATLFRSDRNEDP